MAVSETVQFATSSTAITDKIMLDLAAPESGFETLLILVSWSFVTL